MFLLNHCCLTLFLEGEWEIICSKEAAALPLLNGQDFTECGLKTLRRIDELLESQLIGYQSTAPSLSSKSKKVIKVETQRRDDEVPFI